MRALIVSDIHSNLAAFQAVLDDAASPGGFDEVWSLGDLVGYGPDPVECIGLLRSQNHVSIVGNHDLAAIGAIDAQDFNSHARFAAHWTASRLSAEEVEFLTSLPQVATQGDWTLVHGSLRMPVVEYLLSPEAAAATFDLLKTQFCLVGHSHIPFICREGNSRYNFDELPEGQSMQLGEGRLIVNPGSVGQPRDHDPRPSYVIFDDDQGTVQRRRVRYDIEVTQSKMRRAGLPEPLIRRLEFGL